MTLPYHVMIHVPAGTDPDGVLIRAGQVIHTAKGGRVSTTEAADGGTVVHLRFRADSNYTARTHGLFTQGATPTTAARIRRDTAIFPGTWYDLNEEGRPS